jgi:PhzF family phenazine biosynthesis protein
MIHTVNAFTINGKGGNPAGVVLEADSLVNTEMLSIAKRLGFSETAFVLKSDNADFRVRFFTSTSEVDLCGHATIAVWHTLKQQGLVRFGEYTQETLAGTLGIKIEKNGMILMEQAPVEILDDCDSGTVAELLNLDTDDLNASISPKIVSTGLKDLLVCVNDTNILNEMTPDLLKIREFSKEKDIVGLHVFSLSESETTATARNFAPLYGIDEESATGTSNGATLCYLKHLGVLRDQSIYKISQGLSLGEESHIFGEFRNGRIWIGGYAQTLNSLEFTEL